MLLGSSEGHSGAKCLLCRSLNAFDEYSRPTPGLSPRKTLFLGRGDPDPVADTKVLPTCLKPRDGVKAGTESAEGLGGLGDEIDFFTHDVSRSVSEVPR